MKGLGAGIGAGGRRIRRFNSSPPVLTFYRCIEGIREGAEGFTRTVNLSPPLVLVFCFLFCLMLMPLQYKEHCGRE